jgi:hypothetical protein
MGLLPYFYGASDRTSLIGKSNKSAASSRVSQNKSPSGRGSKNPPMLKATIQAQHRFRFSANGSAFSGTISYEDLADLMCVAVTSTSASRLFDAVKLKEVEIWACNSAGDASNTAEIEFLETLIIGGPGVTYSDTAMGLQNIAHVHAKPPPGSRLAGWLSNTTGSSGTDVNLFRLAVPKGGIVDIVLEVCMYDNDTAINVTGTVAGASAGKTYCRPLDSAQNTAILLPISWDFI